MQIQERGFFEPKAAEMKQEYQVLPRIPEDARLIADRHRDTRFAATKFASKEAVLQRREELRENLLMAAGLYPLPEKTPLNPRYELVGEYEGYTVKKIMFESRPGFWSTGNLYLPHPLPKKAPAILNVIGHWAEQRIHRSKEADYPQQLANFARMGFICLATDMIGTVDSRRISHEYGKGEKELWCSNGLGVQLWNNIRALDLLCDMPEVDAERIGCTGASGGGSQTLFLALADDRVKAMAPINMISLSFQGGCPCENAPGLRRETNNGEMCAVLAPRPLFLAGSTGDWTREQETAEVPAMWEAYRLFGAEDKVEHYFQVADHQYNHKTRRRVYSFFARHLMGKELLWAEQPIHVEDPLELTWYGVADGFLEAEKEQDNAFFAAHKAERIAAAAALPLEEKRKLLRWITGAKDSAPVTADGDVTGILEKNVLLGSRGEQVPFIRLTPENWDGKRVCLALGEGKDCVEHPRVREMLESGVCVLSGDLFLTGEYADASVKILGGEVGECYYTTFHYTPEAFRVQDAVKLWKLARTMGAECSLWAEGTGARAAAIALPLMDGIASAELEDAALQLPDDGAYMERCFLPGIRVLGGIEGCLAMAECEVKRF